MKVRAGKGYDIVYVGHEGHEEAVGTMAVAPGSIHRVESVEEVRALPQQEPVALLAQTTLSHRDWAAVADATRERFPETWMPGRSDLCFATTNRQTALLEIASRCGAVLVIGSANSSNTRALEKLAVDASCETVLRINSAEATDRPVGNRRCHRQRPAPEELVRSVIDALDPSEGVEEVRVTDEEVLPPPRSLRDLPAAIELVGTVGLGADPSKQASVNDRDRPASEVLAELT
ncbi:MAG: hypothetical protein R2789_07450 [Microthrixaceae bacterium]